MTGEEQKNIVFKKYEDKELYKVKCGGHSKFLCTTNVKTTKYDGDLFTPWTICALIVPKEILKVIVL